MTAGSKDALKGAVKRGAGTHASAITSLTFLVEFMKHPLLSSLVLITAIGFIAESGSVLADGGTYLNPEQIDLGELLAPPPALGSEAQKDDLARVLEVQRERTPEEVSRARGDVEKSVFRFSDVLGAAFNEKNLPQTAALFDAAAKEAELVAKSGKRYFKRPRPFVTSSDVHPIVLTSPKGAYESYPSGHATFGYMTAILLSRMVPEKRAEIFARGREFGENRVVDGVHYPSDVEAGRIEGTLIADALMANPEFRRNFFVAKSEVRTALGLN
jgi:acid phosphatase (class A)